MRKMKHGYNRKGVHSPVYGAWHSMKNRCDNSNNRSYHNYGGRGIGYVPLWKDFTNFLRDMGEPLPGQSLDRIDNNAGYSKQNCRWATMVVQSRNRRSNKLTERDAHQIRWLHEMGYRRSRVARMFRVSPAHIFSITQGKAWASKGAA